LHASSRIQIKNVGSVDILCNSPRSAKAITTPVAAHPSGVRQPDQRDFDLDSIGTTTINMQMEWDAPLVEVRSVLPYETAEAAGLRVYGRCR
jgi:hypothetical protein